jgi:esterase/lipase superfamily enzyme
MFDGSISSLIGAWLVRLVLLAPLAVAAEGGPGAGTPSEREAATVTIGVRYLTNRTVDADGAYGAGRGTPRAGRCEVQFAPIPVVAEVASSMPFYLPSESKRLRIEEQSDAAAFWAELVTAAGRTSTGSAVLFIHGYSNEFERACRMAAEVQRVLDGEAVVLLFSWPSSGRPLEYSRDQAAVEWSVPWLAETIETLSRRLGPDNTQVLAHSLGSRGIILALNWLSAGRQAAPVIGELVLLAPDYDAQAFAAHVPRLAPLVRGITVYASENDAPLRVSQQLHGLPRLGQGGELRTVVAGVETVDVTPAIRYQVLGHEYFYRHPLVLADLERLLVSGDRAGDRPGLHPGVQDGIAYWEILATPADQPGH